jgi:hypothetical protein
MKKKKIELILKNGTIYTLAQEGETVSSIGVDHGIIVFAGTDKEGKFYESDRTIDLGGLCVIPGLGDGHMHLYAYCQNQTTVRLEDARSIEALKKEMQDKAKTTEKGSWIKGTGFDHTKFLENRLPTRKDLDQVSADHPIVIRRTCLHVMVANSLALKKAGLTKDLIRGYAGLIETDQNGEPTGVFREAATSVFDKIVPDPLTDRDERKRIMRSVFQDMASKGITVIHTYAAKIWNYFEDIEIYREMDRQGELPLRVVVSLDEFFEPENMREAADDPNWKVKYGSYKIFTDGSFGSRSAALSEEYYDDPGNFGILVKDSETLEEEIREARRRGLQPAIHAIGDAALEIVITAIENVAGQSEPKLPFRIIHAQYVKKDHLERLKKLPVILDIQPIFLSTDLHWIEDRLGPERVKDSYIWKTLLDADMLMTGSSDCPVESYDPMLGIYAAVRRQDMTGEPVGGFFPEERLSVYDALCLFSKNIPYATGDEDAYGTIEMGKVADFVVLERDLFRIPAHEIKDLKIAGTFLAGRQVYSKDGFFV